MVLQTLPVALTYLNVSQQEAPEFVGKADYGVTSGLMLASIDIPTEAITENGLQTNVALTLSNLIVSAIDAENETTELYRVDKLELEGENAGTFEEGRISWSNQQIHIYLDLEGPKGVMNQKTLTLEMVGQHQDMSNVLITSRSELEMETLKADSVDDEAAFDPFLNYPVTKYEDLSDMNRDRVKCFSLKNCTNSTHKISANIICTNVEELNGERIDVARSSIKCQTLTQMVGKPKNGDYKIYIATKKDLLDSLNLPSTDATDENWPARAAKLAEKGEYLVEISDVTVGQVTVKDSQGLNVQLDLCLANEEDLAGTKFEGKKIVVKLQAMAELFSNNLMVIGQSMNLGSFEFPKNHPENLPITVEHLLQTDYNKITLSFADDELSVDTPDEETKDSDAGKQHRQNFASFGESTLYKVRVYSETLEQVNDEPVTTEHVHYESDLIAHSAINGHEFQLEDAGAIGYAFRSLKFELETVHADRPSDIKEQTTVSNFKVIGKLYDSELLPLGAGSGVMTQTVVRDDTTGADTDSFDVAFNIEMASGITLTDSFCDNNGSGNEQARPNGYKGWLKTEQVIADTKRTKWTAVESSYKATHLLLHFPVDNIGLEMYDNFAMPTRSVADKFTYLGINQKTYLSTLTRFYMSVVQSLTNEAQGETDNNWELIYEDASTNPNRPAIGRLTFDASVGEGQIIEAALTDRQNLDEKGDPIIVELKEIPTTTDLDTVEFKNLPVNVRMGVSISVRDRNDENFTSVSLCDKEPVLDVDGELTGEHEFNLLKEATLAAAADETLTPEYNLAKVVITSSADSASCTVTKLVNPGVKSFDTLDDMGKDDIMVVDATIQAESVKAEGLFNGQTKATLSFGQNTDTSIPSIEKYYQHIVVPHPDLEEQLSYLYRSISVRESDDMKSFQTMDPVTHTNEGAVAKGVATSDKTSVKYFRYLTNADLAAGEKLTNAQGAVVETAQIYEDETAASDTVITIDGKEIKITLDASKIVDNKRVDNTPLHTEIGKDDLAEGAAYSKKEYPARSAILDTYGAEIDTSTTVNVYLYDNQTASESRLSIARTSASIASSLAALTEGGSVPTAEETQTAIVTENFTNDSHATVDMVTLTNIRVGTMTQAGNSLAKMTIVASRTKANTGMYWPEESKDNNERERMLRKLFANGTLSVVTTVERRGVDGNTVTTNRDPFLVTALSMKHEEIKDDDGAIIRDKMLNEIFQAFSTVTGTNNGDAFLSGTFTYEIEVDDGHGNETEKAFEMEHSKKLPVVNVDLCVTPIKDEDNYVKPRSVAFALGAFLPHYAIKNVSAERIMKNNSGADATLNKDTARSDKLHQTFEHSLNDPNSFSSGMKKAKFVLEFTGAADHTGASPTKTAVDEGKNNTETVDGEDVADPIDVMDLFASKLTFERDVYVFTQLDTNQVVLKSGALDIPNSDEKRPARVVVVTQSQTSNEVDFTAKMIARNKGESGPASLLISGDAAADEAALPIVYGKDGNGVSNVTKDSFADGFFEDTTSITFKENTATGQGSSQIEIPYVAVDERIQLTVGAATATNAIDANKIDLNDIEGENVSTSNMAALWKYTVPAGATLEAGTVVYTIQEKNNRVASADPDSSTIPVTTTPVWKKREKLNKDLPEGSRLEAEAQDGTKTTPLDSKLYRDSNNELTLAASVTVDGATTNHQVELIDDTNYTNKTKEDFIVTTNGLSNIIVRQLFKDAEVTADWVKATGSFVMSSESFDISTEFENSHTVTQLTNSPVVTETGFGNLSLKAEVSPSLSDVNTNKRGIEFIFPGTLVTNGASNSAEAIKPTYTAFLEKDGEKTAIVTKNYASDLPWTKMQKTVQDLVDSTEYVTLLLLGLGKDGKLLTQPQIDASPSADTLLDGLGTDKKDSGLFKKADGSLTLDATETDAQTTVTTDNAVVYKPYINMDNEDGRVTVELSLVLTDAKDISKTIGTATLRQWNTDLAIKMSAKQDDIRYEYAPFGERSQTTPLTEMYPDIKKIDLGTHELTGSVKSTPASVTNVDGDNIGVEYDVSVDQLRFFMTAGFTDPDETGDNKNSADTSEKLQTVFILQNNVADRPTVTLADTDMGTLSTDVKEAYGFSDDIADHVRIGTLGTAKDNTKNVGFFASSGLDASDNLPSTWETAQSSKAYANVMAVLLSQGGGAKCESLLLTLNRDQRDVSSFGTTSDGSFTLQKAPAAGGALDKSDGTQTLAGTAKVYIIPALPTMDADGKSPPVAGATDILNASYKFNTGTEYEPVAGEMTTKASLTITRNELVPPTSDGGKWTIKQTEATNDAAAEDVTEEATIATARVFGHTLSFARNDNH